LGKCFRPELREVPFDSKDDDLGELGKVLSRAENEGGPIGEETEELPVEVLFGLEGGRGLSISIGIAQEIYQSLEEPILSELLGRGLDLWPHKEVYQPANVRFKLLKKLLAKGVCLRQKLLASLWV
jgi:hypothetical protein